MNDYETIARQIRDLATMLDDHVERPEWVTRQLFRRALDLVATALSLLDRELEQLRHAERAPR